MPGSVERRSATPIVKYIRDFLRGKEATQSLRYADEMATRSPPHPEIPGGPYHKTSKIYYYTRDARREVQPPITVYAANKQITEGDKKTKEPLKLITPNEPYNPVN